MSMLIWLAAYAAPKPLSIFTTVTPLPQLLSIPNRAAKPPETRSVSHAGWHRDDRPAHQPGDGGRQGPFHARHHDVDTCLLDLRHPRQEPVQPGNADIVDSSHVISHDLGSERSLFSHR